MLKNYENSLKNDELSLKLRKSDRTLYATGVGCFGFAIWSLIRLILSVYTEFDGLKAWISNGLEEFIQETAKTANGPLEAEVLEAIYYGSLFVVGLVFLTIFLLALLFQVYIGICACKEATGKKKKYLYILFAFILFAFYSLNSAGYAREISHMIYGLNLDAMGINEMEGTAKLLVDLMDNALDEFASLLLSLTSAVIALELIVNAIRVKVLRKKLAGGIVNEH